MIRILHFLSLFLLFSCSSNDAQNASEEVMKIGKAKLDKATEVANLNKDKTKIITNLNFKEQINALQKLGLQLNPTQDINDIFDSEFSLPDYEEEGILFTLRELGRPKFKKNRGKGEGRVTFCKNVYTLVSEDFNLDEFGLKNLFENISRITNQKIVFTEVKFKNFDNAKLDKGVSFKVEDKLYSWEFDYNEGYFDTKLLHELCKLLTDKGINSLIWSYDGLSHTILVGESQFIKTMSNYLDKPPC